MKPTEKGSPEPSMEEILSSIRQLIATESDPKGKPLLIEEQDDILDLTNLLPEEACSPAKQKAKTMATEGRKGMRLPSWAENIKEPIPSPSKKEGVSKDDLFLSRAAAEETAKALEALTQLKGGASAGSAKSSLDGQAIEQQLRELLRPLLKEWLDANLPVLVRWIVNEQIEKIMEQKGLFAPSSKK